MKEIKANIWDLYNSDKESYICITTNGFVKKNKEAVMGRGIALQAKEKFFLLPKELGHLLKNFGNNVYMLDRYRMFTFPTKHIWTENSDIKLIERSARQLIVYLNNSYYTKNISKVYFPRPGCGNGKLSWNNVRLVIENILIDERIIVVSK